MRRRSGFGWLELATGLLLIVLGVWTFAKPDHALTGMAIIFGLAAVAMGVADILLYIQLERFLGFGPVLSLVSGIISVMAGIMLLAFPAAGAMALTLLFPIWFIAHCVSRLSHLRRIRFVAGEGMYAFTIISNLIGLALGMLMLLRPLFTLTALRCFASAYLIVLGIDSVVIAASRIGMRR